jgi:hypothetical protein
MPQNDVFYRRNHLRIEELAGRFSSFRDLTYDSIVHWIELFDSGHGSLAIKILNSVFYVDQAKILAAYKSTHQQLVNLHNDLSHVYFAGYGHAGSSAEAMLYRYKIANQLRNTPLESHFINMSEIPNLVRQKDPVIVFVDDFIGTGDEATNFWTGTEDDKKMERPALQEIVPANAKCYLAVAVGYTAGITKVHSTTPLTVLPWEIFADAERVLSPTSKQFNATEKQIVRDYCLRTGCPFATGYGDTQALVVFEHNCPNDSLSILWFNGSNWRGLFARR